MAGQRPNVSKDVRRLVALHLVLVVSATDQSQLLPFRNHGLNDGFRARYTRLHLERPADNRYQLSETPEE
jgi:hypothetical protein